MKKTLHYQTTLDRPNRIKQLIFGIFMLICSYPKLLLEVFLRRDMGERYFSLTYCIFAAFILFAFPFYLPPMRTYPVWFVIESFWTWYAFLAAFCFFAVKRYVEIRRNPGVFDFAKYSRSDGEGLKFFDRFFTFFKTDNPRLLGIAFEPMIPFGVGLVMLVIGQGPLGILLLFCSVVYSVSTAAAYYDGDQMVMNIIDKIILNEERAESFRTNQPPKRGVGFHPRLPDLQSLREDIISVMEENDDEEVR